MGGTCLTPGCCSSRGKTPPFCRLLRWPPFAPSISTCVPWAATTAVHLPHGPCSLWGGPLQSPQVTLYVFFDPELVGRLAACGITARARPPSQGFVLEGRAPSTQPRRTVTHGTITEQRRLTGGRPGTAVETTDPRTSLELAEECGRLRLDNQRLTAEISQLRAEVDRLTTRPGNAADRRIPGLDDAAQRFALLELE